MEIRSSYLAVFTVKSYDNNHTIHNMIVHINATTYGTELYEAIIQYLHQEMELTASAKEINSQDITILNIIPL